MESQSRGISSPLMTIKNELLHGAVVKGDLPTARRLLDRHKADINTKNSNGLSVLQLALLNGHTKLSEYLIQKGVDIHSSDEEGFTALHDAALVEDSTLVRKLISKGLSPMLTTNMGELVIDVAGSMQMEKLLCEEMYQAGEVELAKEYYVYLSLNQDMLEKIDTILTSRGCHSHLPRNQHAYQGSHKTGHAHGSSPKLESKMFTFKTQSQVSKNVITHASRVHPSVTASAESAQHIPLAISYDTNYHRTEVGSLPNYDARNHSNAKDVEVFKGPLEVYKEAPSEQEKRETPQNCPTVNVSRAKVGTANKDSSLIKRSQVSPIPRSDLRSVQPTATLVQPPARESNQKTCNSSPNLSRAAITIKSLYQHNSFQLQIGLSLQSQNTGSSLDQEDPLANSCNKTTSESGNNSSSSSSDNSLSSPSSKFIVTSSPSVVSRRHKSPNHSNYKNYSSYGKEITSGGRSLARNSLQQKRYRPLQKTVSFADLPMTRSKAMFVGRSSSTGDTTPSGEEDVATQNVPTITTTRCSSNNSSSTGRVCTSILDHRLSLPADILGHFIKKQEIGGGRVKSSKSFDETDGMFDAGIRALSLKPRKSIISAPKRRTTISEIGGRRRSVTFQPEVLLQEIVTDGDVKAVSEILESGMIMDVNKMSPSGLTALHQSAIDGNLECAKALVRKGANVNCTDCEGWTPLHAAVMNGCLEFVHFLLTSGASPALKNDAGETAYDMAKSRPIRKILLHAMNGKSLDADDFSDGEYSGEEEEEYSHAESESDDDMEGDDPGLFEESNVEEKKSLKERLGLTHNSALNNLVGDSASPSPDLDSVFSPNSHVKFRERELTDSTSSYGSFFEPETEESKSEVIEQLPPKNSESDTDKISESGISTMEGSSDCSHRSRNLSSEDDDISLDSDLDPDSLDYKFQEACLYCDVDMALKLIKYKCDIDINRVNRTSGITALHHSVLEENFALVQHLVKDFEADVHVIDIDGWTPLHAASAVGNIQIAQFLLDRGAKASCLNNHCEFPVDVAEDEAMEKLLKNVMLGHSSGNSLKR